MELYLNETNKVVYNQSGSLNLFAILAKTIDVLVIGGGGAGGGGLGGGGGAGGFVYVTDRSTPTGVYPITVGIGGSANNPDGYNGENSIFDDIISYGGGRGGGRSGLADGADGASGGGTDDYRSTDIGLAIYGDQGHNGGQGYEWGGGGGGGAGEAGHDGVLYTIGGNGGDGLPCSITGAEHYYAGGGGGATYGVDTRATGGIGGGGDGASCTGCSGNGDDGLPNTGGGGGAGTYPAGNAGSGGSGVVIIRYKTINFGTCTGGTITIDGQYTIHKFTESGDLTLG